MKILKDIDLYKGDLVISNIKYYKELYVFGLIIKEPYQFEFETPYEKNQVQAYFFKTKETVLSQM